MVVNELTKPSMDETMTAIRRAIIDEEAGE